MTAMVSDLSLGRLLTKQIIQLDVDDMNQGNLEWNDFDMDTVRPFCYAFISRLLTTLQFLREIGAIWRIPELAYKNRLVVMFEYHPVLNVISISTAVTADSGQNLNLL